MSLSICSLVISINFYQIHPKVHQFTMAAKNPAHSIQQLEQQFMTPPVVATTCLALDQCVPVSSAEPYTDLSPYSPLFSRRKFDYCIVDEASQITLPTNLGPLRYADKFVLVGDHFQLPPLVRNTEARNGGLDISLFRRLSDAHPHAVVDLAYQYRMSKEIMLLSNRLIYGDRLKCGSDAVANQTLKLPDTGFVNSLHAGKEKCHSSGCWLRSLMSEK